MAKLRSIYRQVRALPCRFDYPFRLLEGRLPTLQNSCIYLALVAVEFQLDNQEDGWLDWGLLEPNEL
jgi:hypothetical protein